MVRPKTFFHVAQTVTIRQGESKFSTNRPEFLLHLSHQEGLYSHHL